MGESAKISFSINVGCGSAVLYSKNIMQNHRIYKEEVGRLKSSWFVSLEDKAPWLDIVDSPQRAVLKITFPCTRKREALRVLKSVSTELGGTYSPVKKLKIRLG